MNSQDHVMKCGCVVGNGEVVKRCPNHGGEGIWLLFYEDYQCEPVIIAAFSSEAEAKKVKTAREATVVYGWPKYTLECCELDPRDP